jgi:hypothetical protein
MATVAHSIPITLQASDEAELTRLLDLSRRPAAGTTADLASGVELRVDETMQSRGFAGSEVVVQGVITVLTTVAAELLITWLKSRIEPRRNEITVIIRDEVVQDFSEGALRRLLGIK